MASRRKRPHNLFCAFQAFLHYLVLNFAPICEYVCVVPLCWEDAGVGPDQILPCFSFSQSESIPWLFASNVFCLSHLNGVFKRVLHISYLASSLLIIADFLFHFSISRNRPTFTVSRILARVGNICLKHGFEWM